jgi:threonine/homoserine efflux transporter RhtA
MFNLVPIARVFPAIGAAGTYPIVWISAIILCTDLIYSRLPPKWKVVIPWFVPWGHEFDFYLIERIPIGFLGDTQFIGPLLSLF